MRVRAASSVCRLLWDTVVPEREVFVFLAIAGHLSDLCSRPPAGAAKETTRRLSSQRPTDGVHHGQRPQNFTRLFQP